MRQKLWHRGRWGPSSFAGCSLECSHLGTSSYVLQVIFALPPKGDVDYTMRIYNSDGSEPEMCGNGIRCLARFVAEKDHSGPRQYKVSTCAGQQCVLMVAIVMVAIVKVALVMVAIVTSTHTQHEAMWSSILALTWSWPWVRGRRITWLCSAVC